MELENYTDINKFMEIALALDNKIDLGDVRNVGEGIYTELYHQTGREGRQLFWYVILERKENNLEEFKGISFDIRPIAKMVGYDIEGIAYIALKDRLSAVARIINKATKTSNKNPLELILENQDDIA